MFTVICCRLTDMKQINDLFWYVCWLVNTRISGHIRHPHSQTSAIYSTFCCGASLALVMKHFGWYFQCLCRSTAVEIVNSSKVLQAETRMLLDGKLLVTWLRPFTPLLLTFFCSLTIVFIQKVDLLFMITLCAEEQILLSIIKGLSLLFCSYLLLSALLFISLSFKMFISLVRHQ